MLKYLCRLQLFLVRSQSVFTCFIKVTTEIAKADLAEMKKPVPYAKTNVIPTESIEKQEKSKQSSTSNQKLEQQNQPKESQKCTSPPTKGESTVGL